MCQHGDGDCWGFSQSGGIRSTTMPVELESDLVTSEYWQTVKTELDAWLVRHGFDAWTVAIRARTRHDDTFSKAPAKFGLSPKQAQRLDRESPDFNVDEKSQTITIATPNGEDWLEGVAGQKLTAKELAQAFFDDLELLII